MTGAHFAVAITASIALALIAHVNEVPVLPVALGYFVCMVVHIAYDVINEEENK